MGIFMPFLVLIFVVNPVLRALGCALQPWELIFIFAVGYASMSINELLGRVLATYAVMHYMATPENLWEEYVFGLVQPYLVVEDADEQLAWFYEGLPRNATIPWAIWLRPTFWWLSFIAALGIGSVALATILRRQWVEQERFRFPLHRWPRNWPKPQDQTGFPSI